MSGVATAVVASAAITAGASYLAADKSASASESAANKQLQATQEGQQLLREMYNKNAPYWYPYTTVGQQGATQINQMLPYLTHQFSPTDLQTGLAPNYQFMLGQGRQAQQQTMNVGGGGSNVERGGIKFAEDYASNAYQNALDNYMTQEAQKFNQQQTGLGNVYNRLAGIAGIGQTAVGQTANLGTSTAGNIGQLGIGGASALGAGQIGAANAMAGGMQGIGNAATLASLLRPQAGTAGMMNLPTGYSDQGFSQYLVG